MLSKKFIKKVVMNVQTETRNFVYRAIVDEESIKIYRLPIKYLGFIQYYDKNYWEFVLDTGIKYLGM